MSTPQSAIYAICDRYVDEYAVLDPNAATDMGIGTELDTLTDLSPDGHDQRAALARDALHQMQREEINNGRDRVAAGLFQERLQVELDQHEIGEHLRDLRTLGSAMQGVRETFDLMAYDTETDWQVAARRMRAVPEALNGFTQSLQTGVLMGLTAARRQVEVCAIQAKTWGGATTNADDPFFVALAQRYRGVDTALTQELHDSADEATAAYSQLAQYLRNEYLPIASSHDAVGEARYEIAARTYCGTTLDLHETYQWGWNELRRIEDQMRICCNQILPGSDYATAVAHLESSPSGVIDGVENLQRWLQSLIDETIVALNGTHFDIDEKLHRCEAMIAPAGGAAAMYYTGPSDDFSRPGRTWYPTMGNTRFPTWREVSICYHEAVPGHHLQVAQVRLLSGVLSNYQRLMGWVSGHGEGWALYAERLMGELGYLENPAYELGMLAAQAMRAVRVVVDIGMHLELKIPDAEAGIGGLRWTPEIALPFVIERSRFPETMMRSEVDRYLGLPGQAISYKVGEKVWLDARSAAQRRHGATFDLKAWHAYALDLGAVGLATLEAELAYF